MADEVAKAHAGERAATLTKFQREVLAGDWLKLPFRDRLDTADELVSLGLARWRGDDAFGLRLTPFGVAVAAAVRAHLKEMAG